ncbi:MAG: peptidoglycan editing factor PgeF [Terriglobia bacterium]
MEGFRIKQRGGVLWLESPAFAAVPWLVHGFSTRLDGHPGHENRDFNLGIADGAEGEPVRSNRQKFMRTIGAEDFDLAAVHQIHSDKIFEVGAAQDGRLAYVPPGCPESNAMPEECQADALVTQQTGILLSILTADCMPILLADVKKRAVAAVHAGWRGALNRIVEKTAGQMRRVFGSRPQDILAAVGPSIGVCCYQVGSEVVDAFSGAFANADDFIERPAVMLHDALRPPSASSLSRFPPGHDPGPEAAFKLNLVAVARRQLEAVGVPRQSIAISVECTSCQNDRFFSYRKEGSRAGRMMAVIGIRPG